MTAAAGALRYLWARSARNRLARQATRLRRPRFALGFLVGLAYVWLLLAQPGGAPAVSFGGAGAELAALALFLVAARWWLFGGERHALAFTPAEVDLLFPAPLSRRQLLLWKLARAQIAVAVSAIVWTVLATRGQPLPWILRALGIGVLLATLHLHQLGASLVRAGAEHGRATARRNALSIALFVAAGAAVLWSLLADLPAIRAAPGGLETARAVGLALDRPAARLALWPIRILLAPANAADVAAWARAMLPALALFGAHVLWVLTRDAAFEEAAAEAGAQRARRLEARRRRVPHAGSTPASRRLALPLPAGAGPFHAIVWKNLTAQLRALRGAAIARVLAGFGVGFLVATLQLDGSASEFLAIFLASWVALLAIAGPLWVRNDLRLDLAQRDVLRSWPLRGTTIVAAELTASTLTLVAAQVAVALGAVAVLAVAGWRAPATPLASAVILAAAIALPALDAASLCIQNAFAVLFPDLNRRGLAEPGGIETIGLNMLSVVGSVAVLLVALLLPAAAAIPTALALGAPDDPLAIPVATLAGTVVLAAETLLAVRWIGRVLLRGDG